MIGGISGYSPIPHSYINTQGVQPAVHAGAYSAPQTEPVSVPVQPVAPAREVISNDAKLSIESLLRQHESDPVGMAVRMRIQQPAQQAQEVKFPGAKESKSPQEVMSEGECQTCANRKYQDGSDDPGVSFKTATKLSPEEAATAVRGHEMEHVVREQAQAVREDREVVSQSVTISTAVCPECGTVYASGGETTTVTRANPGNDAPQNTEPNAAPFSAVA